MAIKKVENYLSNTFAIDFKDYQQMSAKRDF